MVHHMRYLAPDERRQWRYSTVAKAKASTDVTMGR
jgi:hypothetical protein